VSFSSDLSLGLLQPFSGGNEASQWESPPLAPPVSEHEKALQQEGKPYEEKTAFLRADPSLSPHGAEEERNYAAAAENGKTMHNGGYLPLVTEANALALLGGPFGGGFDSGVEVIEGTPDQSHVLVKSWKAGAGLYEWSAGQLQLVSVLPKNPSGEELPATGKLAFGAQTNLSHALSNDGSRVFWTRFSGSSASLFVRDTGTHETLQLDKVASGHVTGRPAAIFQTASADGTKVFFTDTQRLTANSKAVQESSVVKPDLYVYELSAPGQPLSGTLRDLTPEGINGESAAVQGQNGTGGVIGASEDGSYVYFVANGALAPEASPGDCSEAEEAAPTRSCNLYALHFNGSEWEEPRLIAVLSNDDSPDWGGAGFPGDLGHMTARVSPNGRYLAFMSDRSLTGYDNVDVNSKQRDEEVFLYDAVSQRLVCASCNPTGARPAGVFDPGKEAAKGGVGTEGIGLVVDRIGIWGASDLKVDHWLAGSVPGWTSISIERALYQSRYLSDSGRLFFNSPDHLVPAATGVKEKVYEYEPGGVGGTSGCTRSAGCISLLSSPNSQGEPGGEHESAFLDASESGDDVFFLTAARLPAVNGTSQDIDGSFDVYDARACEQGGSAGCLPAPALGHLPCDEVHTACKGPAPSSLPAFSAPASASVPASGNVASTAVLGNKEAGKASVKHLTKAQLLAKALKLCRSKFKGKSKKKERAGCEARARKKYGHASSHHKKSKKAKKAAVAWVGRRG
jgi:WD40-like Beta Propeller Repeat